MVGVVSLLDAASDRTVRALWAELDERYGLREAVRRVPFPHCSYHVAEGYDLPRAVEALRRVAAQTQPFAVSITGLGAFEQPEPVLYLAIERNAALDALHALLWRELAQPDIAHGPMAIYAPPTWVPHITLAMGDLTLDALRTIQAHMAGRDLRRQVWVSDLTLGGIPAEAAPDAPHEPLLRFTLGSVGKIQG
jgi:2'-5' RNA ligase